MDSEPFDVQHVRDSAGKGSPAGAGKWAKQGSAEKPNPEQIPSPNKKASRPPTGWKPARKGTTNNRDAFEKRLAGLKRSNPEKYATIMRRAAQ